VQQCFVLGAFLGAAINEAAVGACPPVIALAIAEDFQPHSHFEKFGQWSGGRMPAAGRSYRRGRFLLGRLQLFPLIQIAAAGEARLADSGTLHFRRIKIDLRLFSFEGHPIKPECIRGGKYSFFDVGKHPFGLAFQRVAIAASTGHSEVDQVITTEQVFAFGLEHFGRKDAVRQNAGLELFFDVRVPGHLESDRAGSQSAGDAKAV